MGTANAGADYDHRIAQLEQAVTDIRARLNALEEKSPGRYEPGTEPGFSPSASPDPDDEETKP